MGVAEASHELGGLALVRSAVGTDPTVGPRVRGDPIDQLAVVGDLTWPELHGARAERSAGASRIRDDQREPGAGPQFSGRTVAVRLRARARPLFGPVVAGGPERGANPLASGNALHREPDVDRQADAVADRHVHGLEALSRVDRHGIDSAIHTGPPDWPDPPACCTVFAGRGDRRYPTGRWRLR